MSPRTKAKGKEPKDDRQDLEEEEAVTNDDSEDMFPTIEEEEADDELGFGDDEDY